jgi:DNA-binding transcriptional ArsR family regulator
MKESLSKLQVMQPVELGVSAKILAHKHGNPARIIFDYLLVQSKLHNVEDPEGYVSVSQATMDILGVSTASRRRGLKALEELGLVNIKQEGHTTYRAKLLYRAPTLRKPMRRGPSKLPVRKQLSEMDHDVYEYLLNSDNDSN